MRIALEPEPITFNQVRQPATSHTTVEVTVEREGAEESLAHCTIAEGERKLDLGLWYFEQDLMDFNEDIYADMPPHIPPSSELSIDPEISVCPDLSACLDFPCTVPLLLHPLISASATPPLSPNSPSAHPQQVAGLLVSIASESWTPPRPSDPEALPWLLAPSSPPSPIGPPAPLGSLFPPAPPWSVVIHHRLRASLLWLRLVTPSHRLRWASPSLQLHFSPLSLRPLALRILCVAWTRRLSVSASGSTSTCSAAVGRPPEVVSPSSTMAPPSVAFTVGRHHGCGIGLAWLLQLRVLLAPPWLLPPSDPPWTHLSPPWLLPPSSSPWTLFVVLLPGVRPLPEPPPTLTSCCHPMSTPLSTS
ncbi:A disintegrin and metalloproteinase with thrombospondin motifs 20 [Labeo rohita]|uniref:A disintegrin and metalloproteinase with thrombospondin motifs 20 n=1 Tax=Labeo rohita TaxID=84645 RepID=A0ABQ8MMR2_LABRO|nr:A disintegrin and metalloproteinase with thrombospondin motifs 20 [Labeo rohita]